MFPKGGCPRRGCDRFLSGSPTPGEANAQRITEVVINALVPDIWLLNSTANPLVIDGWWLSDDPADLSKYQIPAGAGLIPPGGQLVIDDDELPFQLDRIHGGTLYLSHNGTHRLAQEFGAYDGHSYGRIATATGVDFVRVEAPSQPYAPLLGPIVVTEINYHPPDVPGDDDDYEFVELMNISAASVNLEGWKLTGDVDFIFPAGTYSPPGCASVSRGSRRPTSPRATMWPLAAAVLGPYDGKLDNAGGTVHSSNPCRLSPPRARILVSFPR